MHIDTLLEQLPPGQRVARLLAKLDSLGKVTCDALLHVPTPLRLRDQAWWTRHMKQFIRSPNIQIELRAVFKKLKRVCDSILALRLGT